MKDVKNSYTSFHNTRYSIHNYPTEWVIRTMLGSYPNLNLDTSNYIGGKILDLGFGDGRNIQLLVNCGLNVYGIEVSEEICSSVRETLNKKVVSAELKVGTNSNIPYPDNFFDYILASSSCYYLNEGASFSDVVIEIDRVLRPGGFLIANFPLFSTIDGIEESFILKNCDFTFSNDVIIRNDIYGIRNGYRFKAFKSEIDLVDELSSKFDNISIGKLYDNYYGIQINSLISVARKSNKL